MTENVNNYLSFWAQAGEGKKMRDFRKSNEALKCKLGDIGTTEDILGDKERRDKGKQENNKQNNADKSHKGKNQEKI